MSVSAYRKSYWVRLLNCQKVQPRKNVSIMHFLLITVAVALAMVAIMSTYLWSRLTVIELGYKTSAASREKIRLEDINHRLKLEFLRLRSPERVERIAREELGLTYPSDKDILYIR